MNKKWMAILALTLCAALPLTAFAADSTFDGTVVSDSSVSVTAPFGGTVSSFSLREGGQLNEGDVIAAIETTKVYASQSGTVTGVFGQVGDNVSDVAARYGAVLYITPTSRYSITADIQKAYNDSETKYVNIGETVYLNSTSSDDNEAVGTITAASGTTYTVETTSGELKMSESVYVYRDAAYTAKSRIGKGTVSRTAEVAVTGEGSLLYLHVADGDTVERGQLLFETVTGTLDGLYATGNEIVSDVSGIIASVNTAAGSVVNKGDTLITVYPRDEMQIEMEIDEYDLADIHEGDVVSISFNYDDTGSTVCEGVVAMISNISSTTDASSDATYKAYVNFTPDEAVRLGMTVVCTPKTK